MSSTPTNAETSQAQIDSINSQELLSRDNTDSNSTPSVSLSVDEGVNTKKRKVFSNVWKDFEKKTIDGKAKAMCNHCKRLLGGDSKNGTKHLWAHLDTCPKLKTKDINHMNQQYLKAQKGGDGKTKVVSFSFNQEVSRKLLTRMVIRHEYPLSIVDHVDFREFVRSLQPAFNMISRNTLRLDIFNEYNILKSIVKKQIEASQSRIAITTDMWTSQNQRQGYMAITAHWIDDSWHLQKRLLRFVYVPAPHTGNALSYVLRYTLMDWVIDRKLSTLTVDNCSSNDIIVKDLVNRKLNASMLILNGKYFQMRCCAHIVNLIVKDGLNVIEEAIEKIRDSAAYWRASPKREEKFIENCRHVQISYSRKLVLDCKTRWNSTYLMLRTALIYKDVFERLVFSEPSYNFLPTQMDWEFARLVCSKLELFYSVTNLFSGTKYPIANIYFTKLCEMKLAYWQNDQHSLIMEMAERMKRKFDKYWNEIHGLMGVATLLDPRFKLTLLEYCFSRIGIDKTSEVNRIRSICAELLGEYEKLMKNKSVVQNPINGGGSSVTTINSCESEIRSGWNIYAGYDEFVAQINMTNIATKSELDFYLEEVVIPNTNNFDILYWWSTIGSKYPTLQMFARDVLAIPISTVASESAFSTGDRVVTPHRNRLLPEMLEALMCTRDWIWEGDQEREYSTSSLSIQRTSIIDELEEDFEKLLQSCSSSSQP